ncbi:ABC transporter permease [Halodesulfovibrio marinisediminis]|uniref:Putative ABC transport system permease protein n=1 Tax=Halodesulfovibrio marinisediminis DSM 17456 TaxID=1121457 RepID=A0A1N6HI85_9BACT|nr:ABC transporter permease [Halodesulfovibrio marinisediminis]SIO19446.1 putative ABC transport system permease protein [Halodesulfovibrio marinisediminis DSM 17456]
MNIRNLKSELAFMGRIGLLALQSLWAYKIRSLFVIISISLGIASLTVIIAAHDGANQKAEELTESFGPDAVLVIGGDIFTRPVGQRMLTLSWNDLMQIKRSLPGTYLVVPLGTVRGKKVRYKNKSWDVAVVIGTSANYSKAWNWPLKSGRDLTQEDITRGLRVCLVGEAVSKALFTKKESPISKTIFIDSIPLTIVGELTHRGFTGGSGVSIDDRIIVPLTTLAQRFGANRQYFIGLRIKFLDAKNMQTNVDNLTSFLRHLHKIPSGEPNDFTILSAKEVQEFLAALKGGLTIFLGITAVTAMIVGGFVLANLFYLSVSERTVEIGLKRAIGATKGAIIRQFLLEAVLLTIIGGIIGVAMGITLARVLFIFQLIKIQLSLKIFLTALGAAMAVGIIFGLGPARQAAELDPIRALRGDM